MLTSLWNKLIRKPPLTIQAQSSLNYVWISYTGLTRGFKKENALCNVQLNQIDFAFENAARYPRTQVHIWLDYERLQDHDRLFVESHFYLFAPPNVKICKLQDIPAYNNLDQKIKDNPWGLIDLSRLLVLAHMFKHADKTYHFYADFDTKDVMMDDLHAIKSLHKRGAFFGRTFDDRYWGGMLENGFMAFARGEGEKFLKYMLIPTTISAAKQGRNGFESYNLCIGQCFRTGENHHENNRLEAEFSGARLMHMGYTPKRNPLYTKSGINSSMNPMTYI